MRSSNGHNAFTPPPPPVTADEGSSPATISITLGQPIMPLAATTGDAAVADEAPDAACRPAASISPVLADAVATAMQAVTVKTASSIVTTVHSGPYTGNAGQHAESSDEPTLPPAGAAAEAFDFSPASSDAQSASSCESTVSR